MSERRSDAHFDPSNPQPSAGGPELTPPQGDQSGQTWDSVLTGEEVDVPAGASGNTEELVGIQEGDSVFDELADHENETNLSDEDFLGFSENVAVSQTEPPAAAENLPADAVPAAGAAHPPVINASQPARVPSDVDDSPAPIFDEVEEVTTRSTPDSETTQVLRRSLISGPSAPTAPAVSTPPTADTSTFEEAMATPSPDLVDEVDNPPALPGRGLARFLSVVLTLIFTPVAWYLVADSSARLAFAPNNPMISGNVNAAALAELLAGLIAVAIIALLAAQSSLGLIVTGVLVMALGVPFLVIPQLVTETGYWGVTNLANWNDFGSNVSSHFATTGFTGIFFALGFLMVALGWVIAAVRRTGRQEEALRLVVASENPDGLKARWARKATQRGQQHQ